MASSSVSQESLDREDYDFVGRKGSRIRAIRGKAHGSWCAPRNDSMESGDMEEPDIVPPISQTFSEITDTLGEHDSPTRLANRLKDKRGRPIHLHKGKTAKDKRKLREKRRSTGVVHLASTESTGDSLDEDEKLTEARKNSTYNEVIDADNPQTPEEGALERKGYGTRQRNKSPSDLEADLEDNQDYDSTVSQSESNLTMIGQQSAAAPAQQARFRGRNPATDSASTNQSNTGSGNDSSQKEEACVGPEGASPRPVSYPSRFTDKQQLETYLGGHGEGPLKPSLVSAPRYGGGSSSSDARPAAREHVRWRDRAAPGSEANRAALGGGEANDSSSQQQLADSNRKLQQLLEAEKKENDHLRQLLMEKDSVIAELRQEVSLLHKDLEVADEELDGVKQENKALIRALASIATDC